VTSVTRLPIRPLILAYHALSDEWRSPLAISPAVFQKQMEFLYRSGYEALPFGQCEERRRQGSMPKKPVDITFDDAFRSMLSAVPILTTLRWRASVFVVSHFADTDNDLAWYGLDREADCSPTEMRGLRWEDLRDLAGRGWEIGSHTHHHSLLTNLPDVAVVTELETSRRRIAAEIGKCTSLAYPYGRADLRVARLAEEVGFTAGCTLTGAHFWDEPLLRPRLSLGDRDIGTRLSLKVSRLGLAARRSSAARAIHKLRPRRQWMPEETSR
jgi:peptidoglycan/xylan/chitin deacetylase (PgdA/CDA1 family)